MEKKTDLIAASAHEFCREFLREKGTVNQYFWDYAEEWHKANTKARVQFYLDNPKAKAKDGHDVWVKARKAEGWSQGSYDESAQTHPGICAYADLPEQERQRSELFFRVVDGLRNVA